LRFDRMVEAATHLNLIPQTDQSANILVTIFDDNTRAKSLKLATILRCKGIATEVYPSYSDNMAKQLQSANQKDIPFVAIIGPDEAENNQVTIKDMSSGEQKTLSQEETIDFLKTKQSNN